MWLSSNCDGIEVLLLAVSGGGGGCCDTWALDMLHSVHQSSVSILFRIYVYILKISKHFPTRFEIDDFTNTRANASCDFLRSELDERSLTTVRCW